MKSFKETTFGAKSLALGLRNSKHNQVNTPGLLSCNNFLCRKLGLEPFVDYPRLFGDLTFDFPFPQVFKGRGLTLVATRNALYEADESLELTPVVTYDAYTPANVAAIIEGEAWHFVDNATSWILTNGACTVFRTRKHGLFGEYEKTYVQHDVRFNTGCASRGRSLVAGFNEHFFWNDAWESVWSTWEALMPGGLSLTTRGLKKNFVLWSSIGGDLLWLLYPDLARAGLVPFTAGGTNTGYDATATNFANDLMIQQLKRNELGWMPMHSQGEVLEVRELGKSVVVYSADSVSLLTPVLQPISTYALTTLSHIGVAARGVVACLNDQHLFIGEDEALWRVSERGVERLGYEEFFANARTAQWTTTVDTITQTVFFSNDLGNCFAFDRGLSTVHQLMTSGLVHFGKFSVVSSFNGQSNRVVVTNPVTFGLVGLKRLQSVEATYEKADELAASCYVAYDAKGTYQKEEPVLLNDVGWAELNSVGTKFCVALRCPYEDEVELSQLALNWEPADKRNLRGGYAQGNQSE